MLPILSRANRLYATRRNAVTRSKNSPAFFRLADVSHSSFGKKRHSIFFPAFSFKFVSAFAHHVCGVVRKSSCKYMPRTNTAPVITSMQSVKSFGYGSNLLFIRKSMREDSMAGAMSKNSIPLVVKPSDPLPAPITDQNKIPEMTLDTAIFSFGPSAPKIPSTRKAQFWRKIWRCHLGAILIGASLCNVSQAQPVVQAGTVTPGRAACWAITGVIYDCGVPGGSSILGSYTANDLVAVNGSGSLIDSGISAVNTSNITSLWNFNGGATAPTRPSGDNSTNVATTAFVLAQGGGVTIGGTAAAGYIPVATSSTAASWSGSYLPHLTTSVEGTGFPGMDGVNWFLWNAPALLSSPGLDSAPTLRVDRQPTGSGGTFGDTVAAIQANTVAPVGDKYSEWAILGTMLNESTQGAGAQMVGIAAFATKVGASNTVSPTFGGNISCEDRTTGADPIFACIGLEVDTGTGSINGGTDVHGQRVALYVAGGGAAGTHISNGIAITQSTGVIFDRAITLAPAFSGTFVTGFDTANATMSVASVFMAATQKIVFDGSWTGQTPAANRWLYYNGGGALAYHSGTGDAAFTISDAGAIGSGIAGTSNGGLLIAASGGGVISILPQAATGTYNFNLPTTAGTSGYVLTSAGGGSSPMTWANSLTAFTMAGLTTFSGQFISTFGATAIASGACGATTNGTVAGTNQSGLITIGAAGTTTCTISFSTTITAPGACLVFPANSAAATQATNVRVSSVGTTNFVLTGTALASSNYYYICI